MRNKIAKQLGERIAHRLVLVEWEDSQYPLSAWGWLDEYVEENGEGPGVRLRKGAK